MLSNIIHSKIYQKCLKFLIDYLSNSSFHGFNHLAKTYLHWIEVLFWFILILISTYFCTFLGYQSWTRYQLSSTVVTVESNYRDWNLSFPSVTLCPDKIINYEKLDEFVG